MTDLTERVTELERLVNQYHPPSIFHIEMVVNVDSLRLREFPPDGNVLVGMSRGETVLMSDEVDVIEGREWRHVEYTTPGGVKNVGWCAGWLLRVPDPKTDHWALTDSLAQDLPMAFIVQDNPNRVTDDFWGGGVSYPCTVVMRDANGTGYPRKRMKRHMLEFLVELNSNADYYSLTNACKIESGIFNNQPQFDPRDIDAIPDDELPKPEAITTGGNFVVYTDKTVKGIKPVLLDWDESPYGMNYATLNYKKAALVIHKFMAMHKEYNDAYVDISSPTGVASTVYHIPTALDDDTWFMHKDDYTEHRIEFLPDPKSELFIPKWNIPLRSSPEVLPNNKVGYVTEGLGFRIQYFYPTDTGLWAKMNDGYLALGYQAYPGSPYVAWSTDFELEGWMPIRE